MTFYYNLAVWGAVLPFIWIKSDLFTPTWGAAASLWLLWNSHFSVRAWSLVDEPCPMVAPQSWIHEQLKLDAANNKSIKRTGSWGGLECGNWICEKLCGWYWVNTIKILRGDISNSQIIKYHTKKKENNLREPFLLKSTQSPQFRSLNTNQNIKDFASCYYDLFFNSCAVIWPEEQLRQMGCFSLFFILCDSTV